MAKQTINIGSAPNDKTGDQLRTAFGKVNDNFTEIYTNAVVYGASGVLTVPGSIVPDATDVYDLGATGARFKDLHLSGDSLYIGGQKITATAAGIVMPAMIAQTGAWGAYDLGVNGTATIGPDSISCVTSVADPTTLIGTGPFTTAPTVYEANYQTGNTPVFEVVLNGSGFVTDVNITAPGVYPAPDRFVLQSDFVNCRVHPSEQWEIFNFSNGLDPLQNMGGVITNNSGSFNGYNSDLTNFPEGAYTGTVTLGSLSLQIQINAYKDPFDPTYFTDFLLHSVKVNGGPENFGATPISGFTLGQFLAFFSDYSYLVNANSKTITQHLNVSGEPELVGANTAIIGGGINLGYSRARDIKDQFGGDVVEDFMIGTTALAPLTSAQGISTINGSFSGNVTIDGTLTVNGQTYISVSQLKTIVAASTDFADFQTRIAAI
jgi:hypothetical protein